MAIITEVCRECGGPAFMAAEQKRPRWPICWFCRMDQIKPNEGDKRR